MKETNYYVIKKKAVPEVLLKVLEVQKLLDSKRAVSVLEATEKVGISRSSYYKYKDDIFPFYAGKKGRSITFVIEVDYQPGVMANLFHKSDNYRGFLPQGDGQTLTISGQTNGSYYQSYSVSFFDPWFGGKRPNSFSVAGIRGSCHSYGTSWP